MKMKKEMLVLFSWGLETLSNIAVENYRVGCVLMSSKFMELFCI